MKIARMEMSSSLPALIAKYPNVELVEQPFRQPGLVFVGL
jgi:cytochrome P450